MLYRTRVIRRWLLLLSAILAATPVWTGDAAAQALAGLVGQLGIGRIAQRTHTGIDAAAALGNFGIGSAG